MYRAIVKEDRKLIIEDVDPGAYKVILVPVNPNADGYRKWYWTCIIPFINNSRIDRLGEWETEKETHKHLKEVANGQRTTAKMSRDEWRDYTMRIQSYAIQCLECGWI